MGTGHRERDVRVQALPQTTSVGKAGKAGKATFFKIDPGT